MLRTVDDALAVLEMLAERGDITTRDVMVRLGRSRSSAYRVIHTLQSRGWTSDGGNGRYQLGPLALVLGTKALSGNSLPAIATEWLHRLVEATRETATLSIAVGWQRVCIAQVESPNQIRMSVPEGRPFPLYAGASGRSILAALEPSRLDQYLDTVELIPLTNHTLTSREELRRVAAADAIQGYSVALAERDGEAFSVASAITGRGGVLGTVAICGPLSRFDPEAASRFGQLARQASTAISEALGSAANAYPAAHGG